MALSRHIRLLTLLLGFAAVAGTILGASLGYLVSEYRHEQDFAEYRQQEKIEDEMQEDLAAYRRASGAHIEAQRAVAALSDDLSRTEAGLKKEYIVRREQELEAEKKEAFREVQRGMEEVSK